MKELILNLLKSNPSPRDARIFSKKLKKRNIGLFYMMKYKEIQNSLLEPWVLLDSLDNLHFSQNVLPFYKGILERNCGKVEFSGAFQRTILGNHGLGTYIPVFDTTILNINTSTYEKDSIQNVSKHITRIIKENSDQNLVLDRYIVVNENGGFQNQGLINLKEFTRDVIYNL